MKHINNVIIVEFNDQVNLPSIESLWPVGVLVRCVLRTAYMSLMLIIWPLYLQCINLNKWNAFISNTCILTLYVLVLSLDSLPLKEKKVSCWTWWTSVPKTHLRCKVQYMNMAGQQMVAGFPWFPPTKWNMLEYPVNTIQINNKFVKGQEFSTSLTASGAVW